MSVTVVNTNIYNPWMNLAIEEYMLNHIEKDEYILYLWQNKNTVVIGKNQNPWRECRTTILEKENGKLARRLSGGGAVYHDLGNLNFTFIVPRDKYNLEKQFGVIIDAVKTLNIDAKLSGRNDILVDNKKFSGNAFCFKKYVAYHHGTLLVSANIDKLTKYLQVSKDKIEAKGIKSVKSRVINLKQVNDKITIELLKDAIIKSFTDIYGQVEKTYNNILHIDKNELNILYEKYASWDFRYGEAPKFDIQFGTRFNWGEMEFGFSLKKAKIENIKIYSDVMDEKFISIIGNCLKDIRFTKEDIISALKRVKVTFDQEKMKEDILKYILNKEF